MKIPLASMTIARGVRRKQIRFRPIAPTLALENDLLSIYQDSVTIWQALFSEIGRQYEQPSSLVTDADGQQLQWLIDQASRQADNTIIYQTEKLGRWVTRVGEWHGAKTISGVKSATGVEIAPFIRLGDVRDLLQDSINANVSLIRSINADNRKTVEQIIFDAFANRRTKKHLTDELAKALGVTKRRARLIAGDQIHKLNIALTAYRNEQLGIEGYIWRHTPQEHPRPHHVARNGKLFMWNAPPFDGPPGYAINCKCRAEAVLDLEDAS